MAKYSLYLNEGLLDKYKKNKEKKEREKQQEEAKKNNTAKMYKYKKKKEEQIKKEDEDYRQRRRYAKHVSEDDPQYIPRNMYYGDSRAQSTGSYKGMYRKGSELKRDIRMPDNPTSKKLTAYEKKDKPISDKDKNRYSTIERKSLGMINRERDRADDKRREADANNNEREYEKQFNRRAKINKPEVEDAVKRHYRRHPQAESVVINFVE